MENKMRTQVLMSTLRLSFVILLGLLPSQRAFGQYVYGYIQSIGGGQFSGYASNEGFEGYDYVSAQAYVEDPNGNEVSYDDTGGWYSAESQVSGTAVISGTYTLWAYGYMSEYGAEGPWVYDGDYEAQTDVQASPPACPTPTGETSTYIGTNNGDPRYQPSSPDVVGALFSATLSGGSFPNRTVKETNVAATDTCYFSTSQQPKVTSPPGSGDTWTVDATNTYASLASTHPDLIGAASSYVTYYQGLIQSGAASYNSCSLTWTTTMSIDNCGAAGSTFYEQGGHTAGITITANSVTSNRSMASGAAK
jgi:hypothetical protein